MPIYLYLETNANQSRGQRQLDGIKLRHSTKISAKQARFTKILAAMEEISSSKFTLF